MDISKLQRVVVDALEDVKAQNIKVYNTIGLSDMFDRVVLASGTSNRQTRALAYRVAQQVKEAGGHVVSVEGAEAGEWVLVDLGDLVVHVMQPAIREYYGLEEIWGGKPVRMRLADPGAKRIAGRATGGGSAATAAEQKPVRARKQATGSRGAKRVGSEPHGARSRSTAKAPRKTVAKKSAVRGAKAGAGARSRAAPAKKRASARKTARTR